jgi:predicted Zn-dependent protease
MITAKAYGDFKKTERYLKFLEDGEMFSGLDHYGRMGVDALARATPVDTGETSHDWDYGLEISKDRYVINWFNTHLNEGVNIAVIIQYGHGTGTGGWVEGRDYINPAMQPLFDKIVEEVWRQVRDA